MKTRFAPSPNGYLHRGHAYSAWHCWQLADTLGGDCLLRIEDIDTERCRPPFENAIFTVLDWLQFPYVTPVLRQSEQFASYEYALNKLNAMGVLYPCFATRKDILNAVGDNPKMGIDGVIYPNLHRTLSTDTVKHRMAQGHPYCLRLKMDIAHEIALDKTKGHLTFTDINHGTHAVDISRCGDIVVRRKDTPTSYHLSVVWDDAHQNITHVTRGLDLWHATHIHRILQVLLDLPEPLYNHHPLVLDTNGQRYAKSKGSPTIMDAINQGISLDDFWHNILQSPIDNRIPLYYNC